MLKVCSTQNILKQCNNQKYIMLCVCKYNPRHNISYVCSVICKTCKISVCRGRRRTRFSNPLSQLTAHILHQNKQNKFT